MRNGVAILSKNIKLDKNYKSVLGYTEDEMISLLTSQDNLVYYANNLSFTRENNEIVLDVPYSEAIKSNYLAFKNPRYSDKWFFAFIDEVVFTGTAQSKIRYTVDIFSTWWSYWSPKACFVIREHVRDDTRGMHTVPENVELGEPVQYTAVETLYNTSASYICVACSDLPPTLTGGIKRVYNGIYSGLYYLIFRDEEDVSTFIKYATDSGKLDAINSIFYIPYNLTQGNISWSSYTTASGNFECGILADSNYSKVLATATIHIPESLSDYIPKNNKLYTYPYSYFYISNHAGADVTFKYEDFITNNGFLTFKILGTITPGCSLRCIPMGYKVLSSYQEESQGEYFSYNYGVTGGKLPICSWNGDVYTNWLTQNSTAIALNITGDLISMGTGSPFGIVGGTMGIANSLNQMYQMSFTPNQAKGNVNAGDVTFSSEQAGFYAYRMCIRKEYAEIIDNYFTRCGYKVNRVKLPNMTNRENYNYIQVGEEENLCYPNNYNNLMIPAKALDMINTLFRNGITIWNNHNNFGNYSVSNNITQ